MEKYLKASLISMSILTIEELQHFPYEEVYSYIKNKHIDADNEIDPSSKPRCFKMWQLRISIMLNYKLNENHDE